MHVRCSKCRGRATLGMPVRQYIRLPNCRHCGKKMTAYPSYPSEPHYYVDAYRTKNETGANARRRGRVCHPGRGGCNEYAFPHRRGSGWCIHNTRISDALREERWESGYHARCQ